MNFKHSEVVERYLNGDCEAVWTDLLSLGEEVNIEPYLTPALAVCREMARRSRENLLTLVRRLAHVGFEFWRYSSTSEFDHPALSGGEHFHPSADQIADPWTTIWSRDTSSVGVQVLTCTEDSPRILPLALRVWLNEVGGYVQFEGHHQVISPFLGAPGVPQIYTDPFSVIPGFDGAAPLDFLDAEAKYDPTESLIVCYGDRWKSMYWANRAILEQPEAYTLSCPNGAVDAKMEGVWYETTFVGYLRKNFQWGGFPGWERYPNRPEKELQFLREGLQPI